MGVPKEITQCLIEQIELFGQCLEVSVNIPCLCNRHITEDELRNIIIYLRRNDYRVPDDSLENYYRDPKSFATNNKNKLKKRHGVRWSQFNDPDINGIEKADRIFFDGGTKIKNDQNGLLKEPLISREPFENTLIQASEANIEFFATKMNEVFDVFEINTCMRKCHFIAQTYHETERFTRTYEGNPRTTYEGGIFFRGRGLIQLTGLNNYRSFFEFIEDKSLSDDEIKALAPSIAQSLYLSCFASAWFWDNNNINAVADGDTKANNADSIRADDVSKIINPREEEGQYRYMRRKFTNDIKRLFDFTLCPL